MIVMRLEELIINRGLRKGYISKQMGINPNTLSSWIKSKSYPRLDQSVILADLLQCDIHDLYIKD